MNLNKLSKREKIIAVITTTIILLGVLTNFIVLPLSDKIISNNDILQKKTLYLARYFPMLEQGESAASLYKDYQDILDTSKSTEDVLNELFKQAEALAKKLKINLMEVKPLGSKVEGKENIVSLEFMIEGNFNSLFRFVNLMEQSSPMIAVESLDLASQAQTKDLRCRIVVVKSYF